MGVLEHSIAHSTWVTLHELGELTGIQWIIDTVTFFFALAWKNGILFIQIKFMGPIVTVTCTCNTTWRRVTDNLIYQNFTVMQAT